MEGKIILFSVLAFFGIALWISWDFLILHDAFYFTNSPFSAKSQQQGWLARGELPTYHNLSASLLYYGDAAYRNIGFVISILSVCGALLFILEKNLRYKFYALSLFFVPFVFYVLTLYMGQSVIFIPDLTPAAFGWKLFNVRYGLMMIPAAAFFTGYLLYRLPQLLTFDWLVDKENIGRKNKFFSAMNHTILIQGGMIILLLIGLQTLLFATEAEPIMTLQDGTIGLSASRSTSAQEWLIKNYDTGLVLIDDYARTVSIIKSGIPMQEVIYIGNKPYWDESLRQPEKYAKWIVMQKGDSVWSALMDNPRMQGDLYKYFEKAYTSPEILVFKRSQTKALSYNH